MVFEVFFILSIHFGFVNLKFLQCCKAWGGGEEGFVKVFLDFFISSSSCMLLLFFPWCGIFKGVDVTLR